MNVIWPSYVPLIYVKQQVTSFQKIFASSNELCGPVISNDSSSKMCTVIRPPIRFASVGHITGRLSSGPYASER
jgi:hypothetical protein